MMKINERLQLYFEDLKPEVQEKVIEFLGDNGNYDIIPILTLYNDEEIIRIEDESYE